MRAVACVALVHGDTTALQRRIRRLVPQQRVLEAPHEHGQFLDGRPVFEVLHRMLLHQPNVNGAQPQANVITSASLMQPI